MRRVSLGTILAAVSLDECSTAAALPPLHDRSCSAAALPPLFPPLRCRVSLFMIAPALLPLWCHAPRVCTYGGVSVKYRVQVH
jgi:hypothetical protein